MLLYIVEVWGKLSWHETWGENSICGGVYSWECVPTECKVSYRPASPTHSCSLCDDHYRLELQPVLVVTSHFTHRWWWGGRASEQLQQRQCPPPPLGSDWPQCRGWCWPLLTEPETVLCHTTATPALCTTSPGEPWTRAVVTIRADGGNTLDTWRLFSCQCLDSVLCVVATWLQLAHTNRFVQEWKCSISISYLFSKL